jgi:hypothetical protein
MRDVACDLEYLDLGVNGNTRLFSNKIGATT